MPRARHIRRREAPVTTLYKDHEMMFERVEIDTDWENIEVCKTGKLSPINMCWVELGDLTTKATNWRSRNQDMKPQEKPGVQLRSRR